jgi:hypothetical protein
MGCGIISEMPLKLGVSRASGRAPMVYEHREQGSPLHFFAVHCAHGNGIERTDEIVHAALVIADQRCVVTVAACP